MPTITQIQTQKRRANRRNVYLDGAFAFGCNLNVIARFRLREGLVLSPDEISEIQLGEVRQECFDAATRYLETRLHGRTELKRKLTRKQQWPNPVIDGVLDDLQRMNYLDDAKFALAKATSAAAHKRQGPRRVKLELQKSGVTAELANKAVADVYAANEPIGIATQLAERQINRLAKLEPIVARRRLMGLLLRRGFDFETVKSVVNQAMQLMGNHVHEEIDAEL